MKVIKPTSRDKLNVTGSKYSKDNVCFFDTLCFSLLILELQRFRTQHADTRCINLLTSLTERKQISVNSQNISSFKTDLAANR